jgi:hypothetical protein
MSRCFLIILKIDSIYLMAILRLGGSLWMKPVGG